MHCARCISPSRSNAVCRVLCAVRFVLIASGRTLGRSRRWCPPANRAALCRPETRPLVSQYLLESGEHSKTQTRKQGGNVEPGRSGPHAPSASRSRAAGAPPWSYWPSPPRASETESPGAPHARPVSPRTQLITRRTHTALIGKGQTSGRPSTKVTRESARGR